MMTFDEKVDVLVGIGPLNREYSEYLLGALERMGLTIYRKKVVENPRRPNTSAPMTSELAQQIRDYFAAHPDTPQHEIAHIFNVNSGRVNEALKGAW
jgi:hypothetical protein